MAKVAPMLGALLMAARKPSEKQMAREHAKHAMRRATDDWVDGRITTKEHGAVHERGKHVLAGKSPKAFKGQSGERKLRGLM